MQVNQPVLMIVLAQPVDAWLGDVVNRKWRASRIGFPDGLRTIAQILILIAPDDRFSDRLKFGSN